MILPFLSSSVCLHRMKSCISVPLPIWNMLSSLFKVLCCLDMMVICFACHA